MNTPSNYPLPIDIPDLQYFTSTEAFQLESGDQLQELTLAYHTYGQLNEKRDNVIWVCHALTANSHVADWWSGLFGSGKLLDPERYFIVCANMIGSCYGSTGARSIDPMTGKPFGLDFPFVTISDIVESQYLLFQDLGLKKIQLIMGGSCGGHQALEWGLRHPEVIRRLGLLVTSAKETAWAISIHEAGRMALWADTSFQDNTDGAGKAGLRAARAIGLLGYRTIEAYLKTQSNDDERIRDFSASSYVQYQGLKLERRFYAHCYYHLLNTLDGHNVGRNRGGIEKALSALDIPALVLGIDTDMLIPTSQQKILAQHLPQATYREIHSDFGHDGFLIESEQIDRIFQEWWKRSE